MSVEVTAPVAHDPSAPAPEANPQTGQETGRRSGGPKDTSRTRYNAVKTTLASKGLLPQEADQVEQEKEKLRPSFEPQNAYQEDRLEDIALYTLRMRKAQIFGMLAIERLQNRSGSTYAADRASEVADLAEGLSRRPTQVAAKLKTSAIGIDYLLQRWYEQECSYVANGGWTARQRERSFDLLGIPHEARADSPALPEHDEEALLAVIAAEVEELKRLRAEGLDRREQEAFELGQAGYGLEEHPEVKRMRRYERDAKRELKWAIKELRDDQARLAAAAAAPVAEPAPVAPPVAPPPDPAPTPAAAPVASGSAPATVATPAAPPVAAPAHPAAPAAAPLAAPGGPEPPAAGI